MRQPESENKTVHELVADEVLLMGILNVTPDSFSDGGRFFSPQSAVEQAQRLAGEGAHIIDIGGESTRPGAKPVPVDEELERVMPVIEALAAARKSGDGFAPRISIDTRKAVVMGEAVKAGADLINDVSALQYDEEALAVAAKAGCPVILMHGKGDPATMQDNPVYGDVVTEVYDYLRQRLELCEKAGIDRARLVIDPGIGFGKTLEHNLALLAHLDHFAGLGVPLLLGASRKRFIGALSGEEEATKRAPGSIAAALFGVAQGVKILRVHDVAQTRQALTVWRAVEAVKNGAG